MSDKLPPVDGFEYPDKPDPDEASQLELMQYLEQVDYYWTLRGSQKMDHSNEDDESDE